METPIVSATLPGNGVKDQTVLSSISADVRPGAVWMALAMLWLAAPAQAQLTRGFDLTARAEVPAVELARQPDMWMMEVQFKSMRMVTVELPDAMSGELKPEVIWYLPWRSLVRPIHEREPDAAQPVNNLDDLPGPRQFIPEFTLITYDDPNTEVPSQIARDEILPAAMLAIRRIERAPHLNSVQVIQDLPQPVETGTEEEPWIYGAATWRGVDPETDFFKVILSGFTNAYELREGSDDGKQVWRKVIVQRYSRPGDRFDPSQREFLSVGTPAWVYQPDPLPAAAK